MLLLSPEYSPSQGSFQCKYKVSMNGSATDSKLALSFRNFNLPGATLNVTTDLNATQELTGKSCHVSWRRMNKVRDGVRDEVSVHGNGIRRMLHFCPDFSIIALFANADHMDSLE